MIRRILAVSAIIALSGCAGVTTAQIEEFTKDHILTIAAFDLNCPKENMEFTVLEQGCGWRACTPVEVGVRGCGSQARYTLVQGKYFKNSHIVGNATL